MHTYATTSATTYAAYACLKCLPNTFTEILPLEFRLLNSKWLILGTYKPPSQNETTYVSEIQKLLTYYRSLYDNILLLGDFNMPFSNKNMKNLCHMFELNHLIKGPTCFKSSKPSCIDNFYTNKNTIIFNSSTVETGISDHYSLICTMLRCFVKVQQNLCTTGPITTIIKNSSKWF